MPRRLFGGRVLKWAAGALAILLVLLAAFFGLLQTPFAKRKLAAFLSDTLSGPHFGIGIEGIQGFIPFDMGLERLVLRDGRGEWLSADNMTLRWAPWKLLQGRIVVREIGASAVEMERAPQGAEAEKEEPPAEPGPPRLPESLPQATIERLFIQRLTLEKPVLGEAAVFGVNGQVRPSETASGLTAELHVQRKDAPLPEADVRASIEGDPSVLRLQGAVHDSSGGLLSSVLGLDDAGSLFLKIDGEGPLSAWKGDVHAGVGDFGEVRMNLALGLHEHRTTLECEADVRAAPSILPPGTAPVIGEETRIRLAAAFQKPGALVVDNLTLRTAGPALDLAGRYDLESQTVDAEFGLRIEELAPFQELARMDMSGRLTLEGRVSGPVRAPEGAASLKLHQARIQDYRVRRLNFNVKSRPLENAPAAHGVRVLGEGDAEGLVQLQGPGLPEDRLQWSFDVKAPYKGPVSIETFRLQGKSLAFNAEGSIDPQGPDGSLDAELKVRELAILASLAGLEELSGAVSLDLHVQGNAGTGVVSGTLQGAAEGLEGLPPAAGPLVGSQARMHVDFGLDEGKLLSVPKLQLKGAALDLSAEAHVNLDKNSGKGQWKLALPRLGVLSSALNRKLAGALRVSGNFDGPFSNLAVTTSLEGSGITVDQAHFDALSLDVTGRNIPQNPEGTLDLKAGKKKETLTLQSDFALKGSRLKLARTQLRALNTRADADLSVNLDSFLTQGTLAIKSPSLTGLGRFLGQDLQGRLMVDGRFTTPGGSQSVRLDVEGEGLAVASQEIQNVSVSADMKDVLENPQGRASAKVQGLRSGSLRLDSLGLEVRGNARKVSFEGQGRGGITEPFTVELKGDAALSDKGEVVRLERLGGRFGEERFDLLRPLSFRRSGDRLELGDLALKVASGKLEASGRYAPRSVELDLDVQDLPLRLARYAGISDLSGSADATVRMSGTPSRVRGEATLDVQKARMGRSDLKNLPPADITLEASLEQSRLRADLTLEGPTVKPVRAGLDAPATLSLDPFAFAVPQDGRLEGNLEGEVDVARVMRFFPLDGQKLSGIFATRLDVGGTVDAPKVTGRAEVRKGSYENFITGTVLRDLEMVASADLDRFTVQKLSASDGGRGSLSGKGHLNLNAEERFPFDVSLTLDRARLVRRTDATAVFDGSLSLSGTLKEASVKGELDVAPAEIRIPEEVPPSVPELEVTEVNRPGGLEEEQPKREESQEKSKSRASGGMAIFLDVGVGFPRRVFVRGRGLDSQWEGDLKVGGRADSPIITGELSVVRGNLELLDKRFNLAKSSIQFFGSQPPSPKLNITAETNAGEILARLRITGDVSSPEISFESEPPLPEDEILSHVLFGRSMGDLTPLQSLRIANALRILSGKGPTTDIMGRMRNILGLDYLDIKQQDEEGATVGVGRYLAEGVYLNAEQSISGEGGTASLEVEVTPNITIESEVGTDSEAGIGVNWRFDY